MIAKDSTPVAPANQSKRFQVSDIVNIALTTLDRAIKAGYALKEIRGEPELVELRNDIRYHKDGSQSAGTALVS